MSVFKRKGAKPAEAPESEPRISSNHLSNVIEIGSSDASVGDSNFTLPFLTGLYNLGRQRAVDAGITRMTEEFLEPLEAHARGIAREFTRAKFDPSTHLHDKMQYDEYERALRLRDDARVGEDHAVARLREDKAALDAARRVGDRPSRPSVLLFIAVAMMAVSLTATCHDRLMPPGMEPLLSLVLSMIVGTLLAAAPVYAIFHGRNSKQRWIGIIVGILFAVALFTVRIAGAEKLGEYLYSAGWAVLELVGVLLAEYISQAHRKAEVEWEEDHHREVAVMAAVDSSKEDIARWRDQNIAAQREIERVSLLVNDRNSRALRVKEIETLCIKSVRDGASDGVAQNLGIVRGLKRPPRAAHSGRG
jgi:hypothetical protein